MSEQRGQVWPLVLTLLLGLTLVGLPFLSAGYAEGTVALTQWAADAAALAGAEAGAQVTQQTDAFGDVYCTSVTVDQDTALQAATNTWLANTTQGFQSGSTTLVPPAMPSLATTGFSGVAAGNTFAVTAEVQAPPGGLVLVGVNPAAWTVTAKAEVQQPPGALPCP